MKKKLLLAVMLGTSAGSTIHPISWGEIQSIITDLDNWVEQEVNSIVKKVGGGLDLNKIIQQVYATQRSVNSIVGLVGNIPKQLQAKNGPLTTSKNIASQIDQFTKLATKVSQTVTDPSQIGDALFDPSKQKKITGAVGTDLFGKLLTAHNNILSSLNNLQVRPTLQTVQTTLRTFTQTINNVISVRDSAGILGKSFFPDSLKNSFLKIVGDFNGIANNLGSIIQGGLPNFTKLEQDLINGLLNNLFTTRTKYVKVQIDPKVPIDQAWQFKKEQTIALVGLVEKLLNTTKDMITAINEMKGHIVPLMTNMNGLIATAKNIDNRLETRLKNEVNKFWNKVKDNPLLIAKLNFNPVGWVKSELNKTIKQLGFYLHKVLDNGEELLKDVTGMYFKVFDKGTDPETDDGGVIHALKVYIGTDLLSAQTIKGFRGIGQDLSKLTDDFGTFIGQLNDFIKRFRI